VSEPASFDAIVEVIGEFHRQTWDTGRDTRADIVRAAKAAGISVEIALKGYEEVEQYWLGTLDKMQPFDSMRRLVAAGRVGMAFEWARDLAAEFAPETFANESNERILAGAPKLWEALGLRVPECFPEDRRAAVRALYRVVEAPKGTSEVEFDEPLDEAWAEPDESHPGPELGPEFEPGEPEPEEMDVKRSSQSSPRAVGPAAPVMPVRSVRRLMVHKAFDLHVPDSDAGAAQVDLLNRKHAVIGNYGGKLMVLSYERWGPFPEVMVPIFQSAEHFQKRYMRRYAEVQLNDAAGTVRREQLGGFWLRNPGCRYHEAVEFEPGTDAMVLVGNRLNLWSGLSVEPRPGAWPLMQEHIYEVLGNGDQRAGDYIVNWTAWMYQNLGDPPEVALVFQGDEGVGKGAFARAQGTILGPHWLPVSDPKHLTGSFSGHLHHCVFLFLDEAFAAGGMREEGRLKSIISEEMILIEPKYVQPFPVRNRLHIMMASNNDWVVPAGHGARRYAVFRAGDKYKDNWGYFAALKAEMENGGLGAMLFDLLNRDLRGWHPRQLYKTQALLEQKQRSLRGLDAWFEDMLQNGCLPPPGIRGYPNRAFSQGLLNSARQYDSCTNETVVAAHLKKILRAGGLELGQFNKAGARGWKFPELNDCRAAWEARFGGRWDWLNDESQWSKVHACGPEAV
jgi:hypothetical protein